MALTQRSLFLFGLQVTELNRSIDFQIVLAGPTKLATLKLGFYSLQGLCDEVARAMFEADPTNVYTCTANRNVSGGLENRVTISTTGAFLRLLFGSGPRTASSTAPLIGFVTADQVGATSYTGSSSAGTRLLPDYVGYNYLGPTNVKKVFGNVNVSASGKKESIVFQIQKFIHVQFKFEPRTKVESNWPDLWDWLIQQRPFEFTPEFNSPSGFFDVTLEKTEQDGKGLAYQMKEMLPFFPNHYDSGLLVFRVRAT